MMLLFNQNAEQYDTKMVRSLGHRKELECEGGYCT